MKIKAKHLKNKVVSIPLGARSAIVYTASTVFSRGLAIITVPIFTRLMSSEQIGVVNVFNTWHGLLSVVATLSLTSGGFAVAMKEFEKCRDEYVSSVQTLTSLVSLLFGLIYFSASAYWNDLLGLPTSLMILMLVCFFFEPARDFWMSKQRYEYKYKIPGLVSFISALAASVVSVLVVLNMQNDQTDRLAEGRLISNYGILLGVAAIIWIYHFIKGKTLINLEYWKFSLKLSIPLIGYQFAAQILSASDRLMIDRMVGKEAVGIYGTLYSISSISLLVWNAINASFVPYLFQNIEKKGDGIKRISFGLLEVYGGIAVLLTLFAPEIVKILATDEYYEAIYIMPPISAGIFFTSVAHMYSNILVYYKKTKYVMYGSAIAAVLNVVLNIIFIPVFGYMAAAYTTLIGYVVMAVLEALWANRLHSRMIGTDTKLYDDKKIIVLSIFVIGLSMSGLLLYWNNALRFIMIALGVVFVIYSLLKYKKQKADKDIEITIN